MHAFKAQLSAPLQQQIADHLAQQIISGELPDKSRLPSTVELAKLYNVTPVTIHKSLQHLVKRQLIERRSRQGTFVRSQERVNVIALVFGENPFSSKNHIYALMIDHFQRQALERDLNLKIYFDFESGGRTMFDLEQDLRSGELKAIIAANRVPSLTEFLESHTETTWILPLSIDLYAAIQMGMDYLLKRGYRDIAVISMLPETLKYDNFVELFHTEEKAMKDAIAGTKAKAEIFRLGQTEVDGYEKGKAWLSGMKKRPDAILVNHDIFCRGLIMALLEMGLKVPRDIALLSHMNSGHEFASPVPLTSLEINLEACVARCLDALTEALKNGVKGQVQLPKIKPVLHPGKSCGE